MATVIIPTFKGKPLRPEDENERENLREWFGGEVKPESGAN
jgi:hypothetical protein